MGMGVGEGKGVAGLVQMLEGIQSLASCAGCQRVPERLIGDGMNRHSWKIWWE